MSRDEFHLSMALIFDIAFAIFAEKRFLLFDDYNEQTSPTNIIKMSQTLAAFTDPSLWATPEKRYLAYGVSSMRRYLTFGCFRNYDLGMQTIRDMYMSSMAVGSKVFLILMIELKDLLENSSDFDLRWANIAVLDDAIKFLSVVVKAGPESELDQYFGEFKSQLGSFLIEGPSQLTKGSLMLAIENLQPSDLQEQENPEEPQTQEEEDQPEIPSQEP